MLIYRARKFDRPFAGVSLLSYRRENNVTGHGPQFDSGTRFFR
jgi:hypothetical protein